MHSTSDFIAAKLQNKSSVACLCCPVACLFPQEAFLECIRTPNSMEPKPLPSRASEQSALIEIEAVTLHQSPAYSSIHTPSSDTSVLHSKATKEAPRSTPTSTLPSHVKIYILLTIVGVCIGFMALFVSVLTETLADIKYGVCKPDNEANQSIFTPRHKCIEFVTWATRLEKYDTWDTPHAVLTMEILTTIVLGAASALLIKYYAPASFGSGIPEVKAYLHEERNLAELRPELFGFQAFALKTICLVLAVASGLNCGYEGPYIHLACCIVALVSLYLWPLYLHMRQRYALDDTSIDSLPQPPSPLTNLVPHSCAYPTHWVHMAAAASGAVAVAFAAPVGGCLFVAEEILSNKRGHTAAHGEHLVAMAWCSIVAVVTLKSVHPGLHPTTFLFEVQSRIQWQWFEIGCFVIIGCACGLAGILFCNIYKAVTIHRKLYRLWMQSPILETIIVCVLTATCSYYLPLLTETNNSLLTLLYSPCHHPAVPISNDPIGQHQNSLGNWPWSNSGIMPRTSTLESPMTTLMPTVLEEEPNANPIVVDTEPYAPSKARHGAAAYLDPSRFICNNATNNYAGHADLLISCLLLTMGVVKLLLSGISTTLRVPSGVFIPALVVGAILGRFWSSLIASLMIQITSLFDPLGNDCISQGRCVQPHLYAILGSCAFLSGVTSSWFSMAVISMEITGSLYIALPVLICVISAKMMNSILHTESLYDSLIDIKKLPIAEPRNG